MTSRTLRRCISGLLVGVAVYAAFVVGTGALALRDSLGEFRWSALVAALALSSLNYGLRFLKWQYYLGRLGVRGVPPLDSFLVFLSGFVFTVTPGKVGEVFKSVVLQRTHGVALVTTAPVVVAERLTDVLAVLALVAVGSIAFAGGVYWALAGALAVALGLYLVLAEAPAAALLGRLQQVGRLRRWVEPLRAARATLVRVASPEALWLPTALSILGWGLEGFALHLILAGLQAEVSLPFSLFFYATATLAGALVPVPGGLGVTEGVIHQQLVRVAQVPAPAATAAMLMIRLATLWWAVLVGLLALGLLRARFPALKASTDLG